MNGGMVRDGAGNEKEWRTLTNFIQLESAKKTGNMIPRNEKETGIPSFSDIK